MSAQNLAEGIILQSIEDLWSREHSAGSIDFFKGGAFETCAKIAGISLMEQVKILKMVKGVIEYQQKEKLQLPLAASREVKPRPYHSRRSSCFAP